MTPLKEQDSSDLRNDIPRSLKSQMHRLGQETQSLSIAEVLKFPWLGTTTDMGAS